MLYQLTEPGTPFVFSSIKWMCWFTHQSTYSSTQHAQCLNSKTLWFSNSINDHYSSEVQKYFWSLDKLSYQLMDNLIYLTIPQNITRAVLKIHITITLLSKATWKPVYSFMLRSSSLWGTSSEIPWSNCWKSFL